MFGLRGEENPNYGKKKPAAAVAKTTGKGNGMYGKSRPEVSALLSKKCVDQNGVVFDSLTLAAEAHNTTVSTISSRIRRGTWGWKLAQ